MNLTVVVSSRIALILFVTIPPRQIFGRPVFSQKKLNTDLMAFRLLLVYVDQIDSNQSAS
jgi:hypothetical protein